MKGGHCYGKGSLGDDSMTRNDSGGMVKLTEHRIPIDMDYNEANKLCATTYDPMGHNTRVGGHSTATALNKHAAFGVGADGKPTKNKKTRRTSPCTTNC